MIVHFLDVGDEKYGDCILIQAKGKTILVDGAHPGDFRKRGDAPSIPEQIGSILGGSGPFKVDLLVVTHCHIDHIGCLPTLVADNVVSPAWALVADPDLGFPKPGGAGRDDADPIVAKVIAGLREEPRVDFRSDGELDRFLTDAATLEDRYRQMLDALPKLGTKVVRFFGVDAPTADLRDLLGDFAGLGLEILGPTQNHLLLCTKALADLAGAAKDAAQAARQADLQAAADAPSLYRLLNGASPRSDAPIPDSIAEFVDRPGRGAALNDQSIVLKLDDGGGKVLLTGDMQLAKSEIAGLNGMMAALLDQISKTGPFALVKLPHHASYNGFNEDVRKALSPCKSYVISTGRGDPGHPEKGVLALLQEHRDDLFWARTDKNGLVSTTIENGQTAFKLGSGRLNDASPNIGDPVMVPAPPPAASGEGQVGSTAQRVVSAGAVATNSERVAANAVTASTDIVEVTARIPHVATRVTITVDVAPQPPTVVDRKPPPPDNPPLRWPPLANGRTLPGLVFVTNMARLGANIGITEAEAAAQAIRSAGQALVDAAEGQDVTLLIRQACAGKDVNGIVILGGYDVVRSLTYDVLPPALRAQLGHSSDDPDDFVVWSDQIYGDTDGDGMANLPVSRIPDARSAELVKNCLCGVSVDRRSRYGLRNDARPFAEGIFQNMAGPGAMAVSEPTRPGTVLANDIDAAAIYLMLHGSDVDGTRYWGERRLGGIVEALTVANVPKPCAAVVFAGCCWGGLTVRTPANRYRSGDPLQSLTPEQSLALSFLATGARAFVGCTGAHYSPYDANPRGDLNYFGGPMHRSFWTHLQAGESPASALFKAKVDYIRDMPHGRRTAEEQAIEYKILRQFTCLGLGW